MNLEHRPDRSFTAPRRNVSGEADFLIEAVVADLAAYESLLLDDILAIGAVTDARSSFAIRTVLSRGLFPVHH